MIQCIRHGCTNDAKGGNSYKTSMCNPCKRDISNNAHLHVTCTVCKKPIFIQNLSGGPRLVCGETCAKKRVAERNKSRYASARHKDIQCLRCDKPLRRQGKKHARSRKKFCSKSCYDKNEYYRNLFKRHFTKLLRLQPIIIRTVLR